VVELKPKKWDELEMDTKLVLVEGWARDGLIDKQIAENLGVSYSTLKNWKREYPQFKEALSKGKEVVDRHVENALLKRALGFYYEEDAMSAKGDVKKVRKYQIPDTRAAMYWLNNRLPEKYRDKQHLEHTGKDGGPIEFSAKAELISRIARIVERTGKGEGSE
jgi:transposase-like protein